MYQRKETLAASSETGEHKNNNTAAEYSELCRRSKIVRRKLRPNLFRYSSATMKTRSISERLIRPKASASSRASTPTNVKEAIFRR